MSIKDKFPTRSPSLVLDFINTDQLDPRITFGRSDATSCATYFDSNGILRIADANVPRLDHDPVTLKRKGLLIEESRQNRLKYSNSFSTTPWEVIVSGTGSFPTLTQNYSLAPDGTTTAWRLQATIGAGTSINDSSVLRQQITGLADPHPASISIWIKSNTGSSQSVYLRNVDGSTGSTVTATTSWTRVYLSTASYASTSDYFQIGSRGTLSTQSVDISIWGAQFESELFATSYIPTDASTVTRAVDVAQINVVSPWYNQLEGTWYTSAIVPNSANTGAQRRIHVSAHNLATPTADFYQVGRNTGTGLRYFSRVGDVAQIGVNGITNNPVYDDSGYAKIAIGYKADNYAATGDGRAPTKFTSTALVPTVDYIILGNTSSYSDLSCLNGHLQRIAYYTILLNDAELQELTTTP